jgi:hypothetical protein
MTNDQYPMTNNGVGNVQRLAIGGWDLVIGIWSLGMFASRAREHAG